MGRSRFLSFLLLSLVLTLCFYHGLGFGFGRRMRMVEGVDRREDSAVEVKESAGKWRMGMEIMDYSDPEPNTNTKGSYVTPPPNNG